jgi:hypothetical protein
VTAVALAALPTALRVPSAGDASPANPINAPLATPQRADAYAISGRKRTLATAGGGRKFEAQTVVDHRIKLMRSKVDA